MRLKSGVVWSIGFNLLSFIGIFFYLLELHPFHPVRPGGSVESVLNPFYLLKLYIVLPVAIFFQGISRILSNSGLYGFECAPSYFIIICHPATFLGELSVSAILLLIPWALLAIISAVKRQLQKSVAIHWS